MEEVEDDDAVDPFRNADLNNPQTLPSEVAGVVCSDTAIAVIQQHLLVHAVCPSSSTTIKMWGRSLKLKRRRFPPPELIHRRISAGALPPPDEQNLKSVTRELN